MMGEAFESVLQQARRRYFPFFGDLHMLPALILRARSPSFPFFFPFI
jgi:hypothetical protein